MKILSARLIRRDNRVEWCMDSSESLLTENEKIPMDREEKRTYDFERIEDLIGDGGGLVRTGDILKLGIDYRRILQFVDEGLLIRVKNGYYSLGGGGYSESQLIAAMFPDGVLTMESGLYVHGYIKAMPSCWSVAVSKNTSKSRFGIEYPVLQPYYCTDEVLSLGVEEKMDHTDFRAALRSYIADPKKDVEKLLDYAAKRKVSRKVHDMIGVWL